jgi:hypothetical protein
LRVTLTERQHQKSPFDDTVSTSITYYAWHHWVLSAT